MAHLPSVCGHGRRGQSGWEAATLCACPRVASCQPRFACAAASVVRAMQNRNTQTQPDAGGVDPGSRTVERRVEDTPNPGTLDGRRTAPAACACLAKQIANRSLPASAYDFSCKKHCRFGARVAGGPVVTKAGDAAGQGKRHGHRGRAPPTASAPVGHAPCSQARLLLTCQGGEHVTS